MLGNLHTSLLYDSVPSPNHRSAQSLASSGTSLDECEHLGELDTFRNYAEEQVPVCHPC
jgi:hypothetical protein